MSGRECTYDWEAIRSFYETGKTMRECQERFGFSNGAWHHAVQRGRISARTEPGLKPRGATHAAVARLLAEGLSQAQIAEQLGVSRPTVHRGAIVPRPRLDR